MNGIERLFILPAGYTSSEATHQEGAAKAVTRLEATRRIVEGELNVNHIFSGSDGRLYVWRMPRPHPTIISEIQDELNNTYLTLGGGYKFRTIQEQAIFMQKATESGLKSVTALYTDGMGLLMPYIDGMLFDAYLRTGGLTAAPHALDNLCLAHTKGIIFGDRWVKNTLVTPDEDVVEIDFDIELDGDYNKEFEMAQTLYHMLHFSSKKADLLRQLSAFLTSNDFESNYDTSAVGHFLAAYTEYFRGKIYEGIQSDVSREIDELMKIL